MVLFNTHSSNHCRLKYEDDLLMHLPAVTRESSITRLHVEFYFVSEIV